ncbi:hypothetical protein GCM10010435_59720 [Winogradskya consettensis]|uniref:NHLP leader peptide family natural product n=2 Tax=Winogradskya TaxID=3240235 RepID=A0A919VTZ0_9ACTN|nr:MULTISPECIES: hypothetical protein [Actinoplanes]GIE23166.1 hypothetical protein Ahu01nite_062680 [Actinoplanes humidus]GIM76511.1 hypothetical protein Aco04nite_50840 [Actinoplanes consettensis]
MSDAEHTEFTRKYVDLLVKVWRDDAEQAQLLADPTAYAIAAGLPVAPGDTVALDRSELEHLPTRADVLSQWNESASTHILIVPATPLIDTAELSEAELDLAAAVADNNVNVSLCIFAETA